MSSNLLTPTHIQKLCHPIEEIRIRALHSVLSKYKLQLVDLSNFSTTRLLLEKLLDWFSFGTHLHEDKVLQLIISILTNADSEILIKEVNEKLIDKINSIKNDIDQRNYLLFQELQDCIENLPKKIASHHIKSSAASSVVDEGQDYVNSNKLKNEYYKIYKNQDVAHTTDHKSMCSNKEENDECPIPHAPSKNLGIINNTYLTNTLCKKSTQAMSDIYALPIEFFPWQPLVLTDVQVLSSLYDGLRYIDNTTSILQSCLFYADVLLKDFPSEIFMQRPLIIQTFLELLQSEKHNISLHAAACLTATVKHLITSFYYALDISFIHSKNELCNSTYPNTQNRDQISSERDSNLNINLSLCDSDLDLEREENIMSMKNHQYSVSQFCFNILSYTIPILSKEKSVEQYNAVLELILQTFSFLGLGVTQRIWCGNHHMNENLQKTLGLFYDPVVYHKQSNGIIHCTIIHSIVNILHSLQIPKLKLEQVIPHCLQLELVECASDYIFTFLFPDIQNKILQLIGNFMGQKKNEVLEDHKISKELCSSIKAAIDFLKPSKKIQDKFEKLNQIKRALSCLEFHKNYEFIKVFVKNYLMNWSKLDLKDKEVKLRKIILLKLLSHCDEEVKTNVYKEINAHVIRHLGVEEAEKPVYNYPGNTFEFLFDTDVLTEIICHGLNSARNEVRHFSTEIFVYILKGKFLFSNDYWKLYMKALTPCLPLLECFANKSTPLGRCIVKMFDPDISHTISISPLDLLRGNLRLLFSKDNLIREEALSRTFWLLTKEDPQKRKLPRLSSLRGVNLSSVCSSVIPEEYSRINQFYNIGSLCNVMEMLNSEGIEPSIRRSALSQISVMLEDYHLHASFLEQNGLQTVIRIFENCLLEEEFQNYPDSVVPIMNILKVICLNNPSVRLRISQDIEIYYCIVRGLFLFNSEQKSRQNGVELLFLLLYNENIINVLNETAFTCKISLPEVIVTKICLPFLTHIHWRCSRHSEPSIRDSIMTKEKLSQLTRVFWNAEWLGGVEKLLNLDDRMKDTHYSPIIPNDMKLKPVDLIALRNCSVTYGLKTTLYNIQNATSHESVISYIQNLNSYMILYEQIKQADKDECSQEINELEITLLNMPWNATFQRFLLSTPCCEEDEILLYHVVQCMRQLLRVFKSKNLLSWIEKLLTDESETLPNVIKLYGRERCGLMRRCVTRSIVALINEAVAETTDCSISNWLFYIDIVIRQLRLDDVHEFYDVAYIDLLVSLLVNVTGKHNPALSSKAKLYEEAIMMIMEVIVTVYCAKDSEYSLLGTNVIKNCLKVLNHMLTDMQATTKGWEQLWHHALSQVTGHKEQTNYCWLISLWHNRDYTIRALALQLLTGFCLTCRACEVLIEQLHIEFEYMWNEGFKLLTDDNECNLVKENAALLLANLTCHGSDATASEFLQNLLEMDFYGKLHTLFHNLRLEPTLSEVLDSTILEKYSRYSTDNSCTLYLSSPSLVNAVSMLLLNILFLNSEDVGEILVKSTILKSLMKLFSSGPDALEKFKMEDDVYDIINMYISLCKLIAKCATTKYGAFSLMKQSQEFINSLYCLVNYCLYNNSSKQLLNLRNKLWCEILDMLSILLTGPKESSHCNDCDQIEGLKALNNAMTENGTDYFTSSLYLAATSDMCELRFRCLKFLMNLFGHEANKYHNSINDVLDRNITLESVEQAQLNCWQGFTICKKRDLNFGERICDVLLQTYHLYILSDKSEFKALVHDVLGNLFVICKNSQNYSVDQGLANDITSNLNTEVVKLNLESTENLKRAANRRRVDNILLEVERSYRLLTDLLSENIKIKEYISTLGMSSLTHKLWNWCLVKSRLMVTVLKMLCSFTLNSEPASRSMVLNKWNIIGVIKSPGSASLLNSIMHLIEHESDSISKTDQLEILRLSFQILENCCNVTECRCLISKGAFFVSFKNICNALANRRRVYNEELIKIWCNFLVIFTSYQEGQLSLLRNHDLLDAIISCASSTKSDDRVAALKILRNISCHQLNRIQLLSHYSFISTILNSLKNGNSNDIELALQMLWALVCNSQKGKIIARNAGFEELLMEAKKKIKIVNSSTDSLSTVDSVLEILQNK